MLQVHKVQYHLKCIMNLKNYIQKEKRIQHLVLGFIGMALFAVGDVLLQSFADKGEDILLMMKSSIRDMPMGRLDFTLLTGGIAAPFMYLGLSAMDSWLRDCLRERKGKMYRSENPATKAQSTENEVVTERHSPKVIEVPVEEALLFPKSETVSLPAGYVHKDVKPAEFEAQKTRTTESNTLNKISEAPAKQRKAVKIIVLYDDGSYQEM